MQIKIKSLFFAASLLFNGIFTLLLASAFLSKNSSVSFSAPGSGYVTAAAVVSVPSSGTAVFDLIEITLKPGGKAFLQFSVVSAENRQGNFLVNALYDPEIISVAHTGFGIEITALAEGSALMQALSNDGIKDVALVTVSP